MSDHWNTLANLLGTPSIDPIQRKPDTAVPNQKKEKAKEKASFEPTTNGLTDDQSTSSSTAALPVEQPAVKQETPSRLRSSWDTVARLFGVVSAPEQEPPAAPEVPTTPAKSTSFDSLFGTEPRTGSSLPSDDELFAGFGKKKDKKATESVSPARSESFSAPKSDSSKPEFVRETARGEGTRSDKSPERRPSEPDAARGASRNEPIQDSQRRKKRPSFWGSNEDEVETKPTEPTGFKPRSEGRNTSDRSTDNRSTSDLDAEPPRSASTPTSRREFAPRPIESEGGTPERRGRRRNIRRGGEGKEREPEVLNSDDAVEIRSIDRDFDDAPIAKPASSESRGGRGGRGRNRDNDRPRPERSGAERSGSERSERPERSPRREPTSPVKEAKKSSWDLDDEPIDDFDVPPALIDDTADDIDAPAAEQSAAPKRRRRRRGSRRGGSAVERDDSAPEAAGGRQVYGRHVEESEDGDDDSSVPENLRAFKVTSWADALSNIIDKNMENHKKTSANDRGRGGPRGNNRRRPSR